jgi:CHAD domain-containing protein
MPIDIKRSRLTFHKLAREITRLSRKSAPKSVHKFRTYSRRVEALLSDVVQDQRRNHRKLLKLLGRLRKKAGRVRDLDVQIATLHDLKVPLGNGHKAQFLQALVAERVRRERKLAKAFDADMAEELRKRLRRAAERIAVPSNNEPLATVFHNLAALGEEHAPLTEKTLHQYRIIGKRARYIAELSSDDPDAQRAVEQLKRVQDIIGDWHDWLKLTQKAEQLLGSLRDSALVALLRNVTQAKFRQSLDAIAELRTALAKSPSSSKAPSAEIRKPAAKTLARSAAA